MRKPLAFATITGIAIATPMMASAPAMADDDGPQTTVGDGTCMAPSQWNDPLDIATHYTDYADSPACSGGEAGQEQGTAQSDGPDDSCVAPWYWSGPGDALTRYVDALDSDQYASCDNTDTPDAAHMP